MGRRGERCPTAHFTQPGMGRAGVGWGVCGGGASHLTKTFVA